MAGRGRYHHGDLPAALVRAGLGLLGEVGPAGFSVAELARRVGVSTAAPYRHFGDRDRLLAAIATRAAAELAAALQAAARDAGPDPAERLAAATGAYAGFVTAHGVGLDVVFTPALRRLDDEDLARAGRAVMDELIGLAREVRSPAEALRLVEQLVALAHGYATLDRDGFLTADRVTDEDTPTRAARAARVLCAPRT